MYCIGAKRLIVGECDKGRENVRMNTVGCAEEILKWSAGKQQRAIRDRLELEA